MMREPHVPQDGLREWDPKLSHSMLPFVSVIIPTHGRREMLARLLFSLQRQSYPPDRFEVIVVHNWTPDGTEERVSAIVADCSKPRIVYHRQNNRSPTASRQFGAHVARGDILAFVDDDCEADPNWIEAGVSEMTSGVGVVQGQTRPRDDQPRRILEKTVLVSGPTPYFETCNIFYWKQAFQQVEGFSPDFHERFYGEDTDLGWKVLRAGWARGFAPDALIHHEVFAQSLASWHREALRLQVWPLLVRKWPDMRCDLYCRYFVSRQSAAFALALIGLCTGVSIHAAGLLLTLPYVGVRAVEKGRYRNPAVIAIRVILGLPRATLIFCALALGSIRYRTLVL